MANANDPQGIAAERIRLNAYVTSLTSQLSAWTGDQNCAADLRTKLAEANFRLNALSTPNAATPGLDFTDGTAFAAFPLEHMST